MTTAEDIKEPTRLILPKDDWSNSHALSVVVGDYQRAAAYREQNHDWRWERADRRYLGIVPQKTWEGTNIPRSNISVMTAYQQVEALLPVVMQALFGDEPWFEAVAMAQTTPDMAAQCRDIIAAQLYEARVRKVMKLALKSAYIYGNGILEACWYYCSRQKKTFKVVYDPVTQTIGDPFTGQLYPVNTGKYKRRVVEQIEEEIENKPMLNVVPLTQFYIDNNCPSTDPNESTFTCTRTLEPIGSLVEWRDDPQYDIPANDELIEWTAKKPGSFGDQTQQDREAYRSANWNPTDDQSIDPMSKRVECLRYKTKFREVWVVNQEHVIYNQPNPYGKIMQYSPFYTELIDRFYGMSIADITDGEQLLQEGLINARIDEIALNIHAHTKAKANKQTPAYQLRVRPGGVSYHDNPKEDMIREYTQNVTQNTPQEVAFSDQRVQKKTGLTDMSLIGASFGDNPGARSATGAGIQGHATQTRMQGQVENITDEVLEPILHDFHTLNQHHIDPDQRIQTSDGKVLDPIVLFQSKVRYLSRASSRMKSRIGLLQLMPYVMQHLMNPALISELQAEGKTVDFEEIFQMLIDAVGYGRKATWIRPLTPQEQQAMQARQQQSADMIKMQMQRERMDQMAQMQSDKGDQDAFKEIVKSKAKVNELVAQKALGGNSKSSRKPN